MTLSAHGDASGSRNAACVRNRAPNLTTLLGSEVTDELLRTAGGIVPLAQLSHTSLRLLGTNELQADTATAVRAKMLQAGYLAKAPIFIEHFGSCDDTLHELDAKRAQKALAVLARKCALAAKADASSRTDCDGEASARFAREALPTLHATFARLCAEGKVAAEDTQALPVPEVRLRGEQEAKRRRGGVAEYKKRLRQHEPVSIVAKALTRVKMGVSEDEQREALLQRADVRVALMHEREKELQTQRTHKRPSTTQTVDEYDDLYNLVL